MPPILLVKEDSTSEKCATCSVCAMTNGLQLCMKLKDRMFLSLMNQKLFFLMLLIMPVEKNTRIGLISRKNAKLSMAPQPLEMMHRFLELLKLKIPCLNKFDGQASRMAILSFLKYWNNLAEFTTLSLISMKKPLPQMA